MNDVLLNKNFCGSKSIRGGFGVPELKPIPRQTPAPHPICQIKKQDYPAQPYITRKRSSGRYLVRLWSATGRSAMAGSLNETIKKRKRSLICNIPFYFFKFSDLSFKEKDICVQCRISTSKYDLGGKYVF